MKNKDRPEKIRTRPEELEVLMRLKGTLEWAIFKRYAQRYIGNLRRASFKLTEEKPNYLAVRHAEFAGQALGIKQMIKLVENAGQRLEKMEEK